MRSGNVNGPSGTPFESDGPEQAPSSSEHAERTGEPSAAGPLAALPRRPDVPHAASRGGQTEALPDPRGWPQAAPPREVISPLLFGKARHRPLPRATGPVDGAFLCPRVANYTQDEVFVLRMAAAGDAMVGRLRALLAQGRVEPEPVRELLGELGAARRAIALERLYNSDALKYGHLPRPRHRAIDVMYGEPGEPFITWFERARRWGEAAGPDQLRTDELAAQAIEISVAGRVEHTLLSAPHVISNGIVAIVHPSTEQARPLVERALALFAEALNGRGLVQAQVMRKLGEAHYLAMHAPLFQRGTPSIVETFIDAVLRARLGVALPPKREGIEPFWEAILTPGAMLSAYARHFRDFFE